LEEEGQKRKRMRKRKRRKTEEPVERVGLEVEREVEAIQIFRNRKTGSKICQMRRKKIPGRCVEMKEGKELETVRWEDIQDVVVKGKKTTMRRSLKAEGKSLKVKRLGQGEVGEARETSN
jgi:hypothetical protein